MGLYGLWLGLAFGCGMRLEMAKHREGQEYKEHESDHTDDRVDLQSCHKCVMHGVQERGSESVGNLRSHCDCTTKRFLCSLSDFRRHSSRKRGGYLTTIDGEAKAAKYGEAKRSAQFRPCFGHC